MIEATGTTLGTNGSYAGIEIQQGGTVYNSLSGTISGLSGIVAQGSSASYINNAGKITGTAEGGVSLATAGKLFNSGQITGAADGVDLLNGGKLVNAGTITGNDGVAVKFSGTAGTVNQLGVDPGAVFNGTVEVMGGSGTLKLASGSSAGTISGIGTQFTGFGTIDIQTGSSWLIEGSTTGLASGQTIAGFANTDTIILDGFTATNEIYVSGVGLELSNGVGTETLDILGTFTSANFSISSDANGTVIKEVTCYAKGTRIATARGEVAVEDLQIGDAVQTMHAGFQKIKWIGTRSYAAPFANHAKYCPSILKPARLQKTFLPATFSCLQAMRSVLMVRWCMPHGWSTAYPFFNCRAWMKLLITTSNWKPTKSFSPKTARPRPLWVNISGLNFITRKVTTLSIRMRALRSICACPGWTTASSSPPSSAASLTVPTSWKRRWMGHCAVT
ncbi:MAG: Hint domain-containing protein [Rhodospirillales bacterium]|nr:Hint domain-containing protein [Rhodospirillales bacterium]